jgi:Na+-translocating ferredoxin:NAD+ oxidoreductase RnfG subunit
LSTDAPIAKYALTTAKAKGGLMVEGGIADVVTGATRTTNAIISAVNAALEQFNKDVPKAK